MLARAGIPRAIFAVCGGSKQLADLRRPRSTSRSREKDNSNEKLLRCPANLLYVVIINDKLH